MKTTFLFIVIFSIALPLNAGWLVAKDFTRITYSSKQGEGYASFDEALKEMSNGSHIQKLVVIDLFLPSDETLQNELFAGLASDAPRELKEALASSGNMHNPKIQQLWKPFEKALLATPIIKRLSASLAVHGLTISRVSCEKFSLISTPTNPKRHFFGTLWLDVSTSRTGSSPGVLPVGEVPWTPEIPYCYDRRQSSSGENPSPWDSDPELARVEYRLVHLMEADRCAKKLRKSAKLPEVEALLLHGTVDHLDEILQMSYHDAIKGFRTKPNPTLLLMMLYHYDAYVKSAMERWAPTIEALREIDPVITKKAENLAGSAKELESKSPSK